MKEFVFNLQRFDDLNLIEGTDGDDNLTGAGDSIIVETKAGNDNIAFLGDKNTIDAGAGDDTASVTGDENSIDGGADNDYFELNGNKNTISGGEGDDEIDIGWERSNITVAGGKGNDLTHTGYSKNFVYIYEGGNDTLEAFKDTGFIVIEGGYTWSTLRTVNEEDPDNETGIVIVNVLNDTETVGTITLTDQWAWQYQYYKERVNIVSSKEELAQYNILINDEDGKNIAGTDAKNIITNTGKNLSITSGADNDEIYNSGDNVTIDTGDGNNYINNYSTNNVTINSGAGNDYVKQDSGSHSPDVVYVYKGGNDTIDGFEDLSTIVLGDASVTASINGNDGTTILRLSNRNFLTFINGDFNTINFVSSLSEVPKINVTQNETSNTVVTGQAQEDAINYIRNNADKVTIAGGRYSDYIVNWSGEEATSVSINGGEGDDTIKNEMNTPNVTIDGGAGNDSIWSEGNHNSINGGDGDDTIQNHGASSIIDGGAGDDTIENDSSNATILGGDGNDYITDWCNGNHSLDNIDAGNGNDFIAYYGTYSTLNGGEGDDEFEIGGSNNLISGGNGDDNFNVDGENNTIYGGAGNNYLWNSERHNNVYIYEGGNDTLESFRDDTDFIVIEGYSWSTLRAKDDEGNEINDRIINVLNGEETIGSITLRDYSSDRFNIVDSKDAIKPFRFLDNNDSGANLSTANSNYVVTNYGQNSTIKAGSGNDIIYNWNNDEYDDEGNLISRISPDNSFLDGGEGNNRIVNDGNNSTIKTASGNDDIWNQGNNVSISSGAGDDTINNDIGAQNVFIDAGEGNNYIGNGNGSPDGVTDWGGHSATIKAGAGNDEIFNIGSKVSINAGDGDNTISSSRDEVTIEAGAGNDNISHMSHKTLINAGDGNNSILSVGDNVTINTGADNDIIDNNEGSELLINAGAGDDSINSFGDKVTVDGGAGSDTIDNWGDGSSLFGGEGSDLINNLYGSGVTINGGAGDDSIQISGSDNIINVGEGNDSIFVGQDGASFTVENFGTGDAIILAEEVSLIKKVDDKIVAGNATIGGLGGTVSEFAWLLDGDIATYAEKISGEVGLSADEKTITYTSGNEIGETLVTVSGVTATDGLDIDVENKTVTVKAASLRQDKVVTISEGYELRLGDDVVQNVEYSEAGWRLNGTTATYVNGATTEGYALENNQIVYQTTDTDKTLITINGVISIDELGEPEDRVVTIPVSSLSKDSPVTISDGYELKLAEDVPQPTEEQAAGWRFNDNVATYVNGSTFEGYTVKNNRIVWQTGGEGEALVTISGVKNIDGLSEPVNKIVTISAASLSEDSTVTISDGYTLALADDVDKSTQGEIEWTLNGTTAIGKIPSTTGGYTIENNRISYIAAGENSGVAVYGVTSTEGLALNDKTITVSRAALNGVEKPVRVSNGYTLALGDVDEPYSTNESWSTDGNKITYSSAVRTAGYGLSNNQIIYIDSKDGETVDITGVKTDIISADGTTAEGITRAGDTFTIAEAALNQSNVKISDGYKLALESDVTAPIRTPAGWQRNESTATYKMSSTTAGYKLVNNEIVYTGEDGGTDLVTVNGINRTDGLSIDVNNKVVTVFNSALSETEITIEGDEYTLALGDDVEKPDSKSGWSFDGKKATYQEGAAYDGYKLSDDKKIISHVDATDGDIKVEIEGIEAVPTFVNDERTIIKLTDNLLEEDVTILRNNGVEFEIDSGSYSEITFGGSSSKDSITNNGENIIFELGAGIDRIKNNSANVTINGGGGNDRINNSVDGVEINGGAGNDNVTLGGTGGNLLIYKAGDGKDNVVGFHKDDTVKILDAAQISANVKGNDVVLNIDNGSITFKNAAADGTTFNVVDSDNKAIAAIFGNTYSKVGVRSGDTMILSSTFTSLYSADEVDFVDGSQLVSGISIDAGAEGVSLIGGAGKDTLISGEHSNFELTGGKGNDVFVYKGKSGTIKDYSQKGKDGKDKIVTDGLTLTDFEIEGSNIILTYGEGNVLMIENAVGNEITFGAKSSVVRTFKEVGVFDERGKAVSLVGSTESFSALKYSKLETINGSFTEGVNIEGNKKANYIVAGKGDSTLSGGKGKDTLVGGDGVDIFIYDDKNGSGNKLIENFDSDQDKISLTGGAVISEVKTLSNKSDLELKIGDSKVTIAGNAGKKFTFIEDGAEQTFTADGLLENGESASLTSAFVGNKFDMEEHEKYNSVNASLVKRSFNLIGYSDTESLIGGKGNDTLTAGSGGSSLWGGKGNDTLYGEVGDDVFIFRAGDGSDTIFNFEEGDMLRILDKKGEKNSTYSKGVFNGDTLTLSIKGGGKIILSGVSDGDAVRINEETHHINGKKLI